MSLLKIISTLLLTLLFISCSSDDDINTNTPNIFEGDAYLTTQQEVEEFGANNYDLIDGYLQIGDSIVTNTSIVDLQTLSSISAINGNLSFSGNNALNSLQGLDNVTSVGGRLFITGNELLQNLDGLNSIGSVGINIFIISNPQLQNMEGLSSITTLGEHIKINSNAALSSVEGFRNITEIPGGMEIRGNFTLTSLEGFNNLTSVAHSLRINLNGELANFCALETLFKTEGVGEDYIVFGNEINPSEQEIIDGNCSQ